MYSLRFYGGMIADAARVEPYVDALRRAVRPDSVVLDLGCGPGLFALLACKFGARRVYAVEPDDVINVAREAAAANGFANRIEFFQAYSTDVTLPEPATIVISDLRGVLPWFQQNIPALIDARQRLLVPGGVLIPRRDVLWATIVDAADRYNELVSPWTENAFGLDLSAGAAKITNTWRKTRIRAAEFLSEPACWARLDYEEVTNPDVRAEVSWRVERDGAAHGIAVWFDTELADGVGFSNHPAGPKLIYGNGFFPFVRPVEVRAGDHVSVKLRADFVQNDYVWSWATHFKEREIGFEQSTFFGAPLSPQVLKTKYAQ